MDERTISALIEEFAHRDRVEAGAAEELIEQLAVAAGAAARGRGAPPRKQDAGAAGPTVELAGLIDHTALKPDTTPGDVERLCAEAAEYGFAAVCVNPCYVPLAKRLLNGAKVAVCSVVGFPLGGNRATIKALEAESAVAHGAEEIDMVLNVGMLTSGRYDYVEADIRAVVDALEQEILIKVILETALLTDEQKVAACLIARAAGADFVKTSTGFSSGGATVEDVALMRRVVGTELGVKASGGIRSEAEARAMIEAGATRIGASASVSIVQGLMGESQERGSSEY